VDYPLRSLFSVFVIGQVGLYIFDFYIDVHLDFVSLGPYLTLLFFLYYSNFSYVSCPLVMLSRTSRIPIYHTKCHAYLTVHNKYVHLVSTPRLE